MAGAIVNAIRRGLTHPQHFEELAFSMRGLGSDRISDITCTILKRRLITYTQAIAARHNIPLSAHNLYASGFDKARLRFTNDSVSLPTNPFTKGPFLVVPMLFLRALPVLNGR